MADADEPAVHFTVELLIGPVIRSPQGGFKYGQATTHWNKWCPA